MLASGSSDNSTIVWNATTGDRIHIFKNTAGVISLENLPTGYLAAGLEDGSIALWNITSGELANTLIGHSTPIRTMTVLGDSLVSGADDGIKIWSPEKGIVAHTIDEKQVGLTSMTIFLTNGNMVTGYKDGRIIILNLGTLKSKTLKSDTGGVFAIRVLPNGKLVSANEDNSVSMWPRIITEIK